MGTRNLTIVKKDGVVKIAQFCGWDGYPSGLGQSLVETINKIGVSVVKDIVDRAKPLEQSEISFMNTFNKVMPDGRIEWQVKWPWTSRDCNGANALNYLYETEEILSLCFSEDFAADSLFCEWCYVIDFDTNTFEVYQGFNKSPLNESDRFYYLQDKSRDGYYPVKILVSYPLDDMPSDISNLGD